MLDERLLLQKLSSLKREHLLQTQCLHSSVASKTGKCHLFFWSPEYNHLPAGHVNVAAADWGWGSVNRTQRGGDAAFVLPALTSPAVGYLSPDSSVLTEPWVPLLTLQQHVLVSRHLSGSRSLHRHTACPQHPSKTAQTHVDSLILQLFADCYVFIAFLNGDGFPLSSRKMVYGYGCGHGLCCIIR